MNAENIRECADLFMRTFSKEPWNDVYESEEEVIRFFQRHLNNNCFTGLYPDLQGQRNRLMSGQQKAMAERHGI